MKKLLLFFLLLSLSFPIRLCAQQGEGLLPKVAEALAGDKDDYAVSLFRQSLARDIAAAEMFYWTQVGKSSAVAPRLAAELAAGYKEQRNYDKAYLFYKEYLQYHPDDVPALASCAEMLLMRDKGKEAVRLYERVLTLDPDNLAANIFLGNYYYLQAERERQKLDADYRKISSPTRMQYARYRNSLSALFSDSYLRARQHLQAVLRSFHSTEAGRTLEKIKQVEREIR